MRKLYLAPWETRRCFFFFWQNQKKTPGMNSKTSWSCLHQQTHCDRLRSTWVQQLQRNLPTGIVHLMRKLYLARWDSLFIVFEHSQFLWVGVYNLHPLAFLLVADNLGLATDLTPWPKTTSMIWRKPKPLQFIVIISCCWLKMDTPWLIAPSMFSSVHFGKKKFILTPTN